MPRLRVSRVRLRLRSACVCALRCSNQRAWEQGQNLQSASSLLRFPAHSSASHSLPVERSVPKRLGDMCHSHTLFSFEVRDRSGDTEDAGRRSSAHAHTLSGRL